MGRLSKQPTPRNVRLTPPPGMGDAAASVFRQLTQAVSADHFAECDEPLLVAYCEAVINARLAQEAVEREGQVVDGKLNPWCGALEKSVKNMVALSLRLRLAPSSRYDSQRAQTSTRPQPMSVEDRHPLLGGVPKTGLAYFRK